MIHFCQPFNGASIIKLLFRNITEASKIEDYNRQLKEKLNIPVTLDGVFIDAFATFYPEDENQQVAFQRETAKLWDFISSKGNFKFKSIQDILDELHVCQEETQRPGKSYSLVIQLAKEGSFCHDCIFSPLES